MNARNRTHCIRGHERTPENLDANRNCKLCRSIRSKKYWRAEPKQMCLELHERVTHCIRGHERTPENLNSRKQCKLCLAIRAKEYSRTHREQKAAYRKRYQEAHPEQAKRKHTRRKTEHPEKAAATKRDQRQRVREQLTRGYIAYVNNLPVKELPESFVECYRLYLILKREAYHHGYRGRNQNHR
jgi:hypothetical protein